MSYEPPRPALRASDADRESVAATVRQACVDGRIDSEELEERLSAVYSARWVGELDRIVADVSPPPPPPPPPVPYAAPVPAPHVVQSTNGLAVASLVASFIWGLGSICAVIFGHIAHRQIRESGGRQSGGGFATAGLVLGYLGLAMLTLGILVTIF